MNLRATLGYTAASLTLLAAILTPFWLAGFLTDRVAALPIHVDEVFSGGPAVRAIPMSAYTINIHRPVRPHLLQSEQEFIQLDWKPASALPGHVSDVVDIDGDGRPDVRVTFDVPKDAKAPLHVNVESLNPTYATMKNAGKERYSRLIVRVDNTILVRIPQTAH
jgi:hypothetical protein